MMLSLRNFAIKNKNENYLQMKITVSLFLCLTSLSLVKV